ncbi:heat shock protein HslJ [Rhodovulum iodosum]|uniref:Heat shock protein HslJ n=1 Tax=Rhodovulum iodosum TaxID=68291 RepID=A0ABV3XXS5_9RHOB|nr:META domain-containing protein [Rhodovulum robiginosum]RSK40774.1 META domain-containing protein [Rhodovulum robiginosum]
MNSLRFLSPLIFSAAMALSGPVRAEADGPDFFRVTGVAAEDVLNLRAAPAADAEKVGEIPPDGDGIRNLGCEGGLSFAEWQQATEAERQAAARQRWCQVAYRGVEGWAAGRFLAEGTAPDLDAMPANAQLQTWPIAEIDGQQPQGVPEIVFSPSGGLSGSTGCNRFTATARLEGGALVIDGPVGATQMACPGALDAQERTVLGILAGPVAVSYDPFEDALTLWNAAGTMTLRRTDAAAQRGAAAEDGETPSRHSFQASQGQANAYLSVFGLEGHLNIRAEATTSAPVVARAVPGTMLRNIGCSQGASRRWCEVETLDGEQVRGWAAADYLEPANSALRAGLGIFDAIGRLPCAQTAGQPTARCEFGVARDGAGSATVIVIRPDGRQRALFFQDGELLGADTSQADGYPEYGATREADLTFVRVGDERYEIPDAVIFGG